MKKHTTTRRRLEVASIACILALISGCATMEVHEVFPVDEMIAKEARYIEPGAGSLSDVEAARLYFPRSYYRGIDGRGETGIIKSVLKMTPGFHTIDFAELAGYSRIEGQFEYDFEAGANYLFLRMGPTEFVLHVADGAQWREVYRFGR